MAVRFSIILDWILEWKRLKRSPSKRNILTATHVKIRYDIVYLLALVSAVAVIGLCELLRIYTIQVGGFPLMHIVNRYLMMIAAVMVHDQLW
jgi:hypothetical protein